MSGLRSTYFDGEAILQYMIHIPLSSVKASVFYHVFALRSKLQF